MYITDNTKFPSQSEKSHGSDVSENAKDLIGFGHIAENVRAVNWILPDN